MNPIPPAIPTLPIGVGYVDLFMLISVVSLIVIFGLMLWPGSALRDRERLVCPGRGKRVRVLFGLEPSGRRVDVLRCSVFGRGPVTCDKRCMHAIRVG
jgi:uncharacterized membrane protein